MTRSSRALIVGLLALSLSHAQAPVVDRKLVDGLYLLAATPATGEEMSFPPELYTFNRAGKLTLAKSFATSAPQEYDLGAAQVVADLEGRFIAITTPYRYPDRVDLISMDEPLATQTAVTEPPGPELPWKQPSRPSQNPPPIPYMDFLEVRRDGPGRALLMRWHSKRGDLLTQAAVTSKGLGPQKPAPDDTDDGVVNGGFGVWNDSWIPDETTTIRDGRLFLSRKGGRKVDLGIPSPVPASPSRKYVGLVIRNSRMIAARAGTGTVYVWTPGTKKWIACSLPEETAGSHVALRPTPGSWDC